MFHFLLISPFLVTSLYAGYEMWNSPRTRGWSLAVIGSAGLMIGCLLWLEPLLFRFPVLSSFDPLRDGIGLKIKAIIINASVFVLHMVLLGILFWKSEPDIPYRDAEELQAEP